jgi:diphthine synthase
MSLVVRLAALNEIVLVGLGLHDEKGISISGLEEVKTADRVFIEMYTSLLPQFSMKRFSELSGIEPQAASRKTLEEENGKSIIDAAQHGKTVLLVPGDPLVATTHVALLINARKLGIKTRIVHGASILSAAIGLSGLHNYKFGKSVTIPFPENSSETPYNVISDNQKNRMHTLCLLDVQTERKRFLKISEALKMLSEIEERRGEKIVTSDALAIGIAQAGSQKPVVKADVIEELLSYDFGEPPHSLIFPSRLHFMEAEALIHLCGANRKRVEARIE